MGKTSHHGRVKRSSHHSRKTDGGTPTLAPTGVDDSLTVTGSPCVGPSPNGGGRRMSVTRGSGGGGGAATKAPSTPYTFAHPLSESLRSVDLATLARGVRDWRSLAGVKPSDELEEKIVDRLIQLERLQLQTIEQERTARRLRCAPAVAASVDRLNGANPQQQTPQPSRSIRIPSATGLNQSPGVLGNRRFDGGPPPSPAIHVSSADEKSLEMVQCRLCNARHSANTECDCSVGSNFVYVSRSLRSQLAESMLAAGLNTFNPCLSGVSKDIRLPPSTLDRVPVSPSQLASSTTPPSTSLSSTVATATFPNASSLMSISSTAAAATFSNASSSTGNRSSRLNLPTSLDQVGNGGRISPIDFYDVTQRASSPRPMSRSKFRGQQFQIVADDTSTGALHPGPVGPVAQSVTRSKPTTTSGVDSLPSSSPLSYSAISKSLPDFAVRRDLVRDFKLLGIRLFQANALSSDCASDFRSCVTDNGSNRLISPNDTLTTPLPAVDAGTYYRENIGLQSTPSPRRTGSAASVVGRRKPDHAGDATSTNAVGSGFPYFRKMALSVHPELTAATVVGARSPTSTTGKNIRVQGTGKAACWTALPISEWKSNKKRPRTAII